MSAKNLQVPFKCIYRCEIRDYYLLHSSWRPAVRQTIFQIFLSWNWKSCYRAGAGVTVLDGCLYAIGGFDDNAPLPSCERYNPDDNTWTLLSQMSCPRGIALSSTWKIKLELPGPKFVWLFFFKVVLVLHLWVDEFMQLVVMMGWDIWTLWKHTIRLLISGLR